MYYSIVQSIEAIPPLFALLLGVVLSCFLGAYAAFAPDTQLYWQRLRPANSRVAVLLSTAILVVVGALVAGGVGTAARQGQWDQYLAYPLILVAIGLALQNAERICFFHGKSLGPQAPVLRAGDEAVGWGRALSFFFTSSMIRYPLWYALGLLCYMGRGYEVIVWAVVYGLSYTIFAYAHMKESTVGGKSITVNSRFDSTYDILVRTGQRTVAAILLIEALLVAILSQ